jgi:hypothetical protein
MSSIMKLWVGSTVRNTSDPRALLSKGAGAPREWLQIGESNFDCAAGCEAGRNIFGCGTYRRHRAGKAPLDNRCFKVVPAPQLRS